MKKKLATRNFILISIALALGLVFTFISFSVPFTNHIFKGFANGFNTGLAFSDGFSNTYEVEASSIYSGNNAVNDAKQVLQDLVLDKYNDGVVTVVGDNQVSITVPDTYIDSSLVLGILEMKVESGEQAPVIVNGSHIKNAKHQMSGTNHGVYIEFTKAGKEAFKNLTTQAVEKAGESATEGTIYIYLNKDYQNGQQLSVPVISQGYAYITMANKEACQVYAARLNNARYGLNMTTESEGVVTHAYYNTLQKVMIAVVMAIIIIAPMIFFAIKYKELGWLTLLGLGLFFVANVITLCLISAFTLNIGGIVGMATGYLITAFTVFVLLEKCSNEYKLGKKLPAAFKSGYRKSLNINIDILASLAILSVIGLIFTNGNIFTFSLALLINICYGALLSLLLMRGFMKMYLCINSTKANKINFKQEVEQNDK